MAISGWTRTESPFHEGELAIQARLGAQERMDRQGRRFIRTFLPEQHREFFAQLAYVVIGAVDASGALWASILVGNPGFLTAPDERHLHVSAQPLFGDPLARILAEGMDIGLLGIDLSTRRRNRLNGIVTAINPEGFEVEVVQSFGNCPQYIQARSSVGEDFDAAAPRTVRALTALAADDRELIAAADTFFIATAYQAESAGLAGGVDVSHRGGKPGFVRIEHDDTLTVPDFAGNYHFNTFGNIELNPRAGLLFVDFQQGDMLYLTGTAEVIWDGAAITAYEGAERLLQFHPEKGYRVEGALPWRWSAPAFSPSLAKTGAWQ